ncbi:WXG100 family type VII secretion target [Arthrobacter antibioticus]|uniref:WXG100 family type VII secretion target n=1 Tax=Arthrobacter sp. H35-MC1 TaxID=3046203 RepID=UPI0024BBA2EC|nr:hypothetical protein [Arthrobacter sp. H35-MC1]MDJ0317614.1 hypothetical protein [Arthrobacter sp. H35-MC1]
MTEGMIGANPAQMRELAKSMSLSGQALEKVAVSLQSAVTQSRWHGPDSERFRQQWISRLRPTLRTACAGLEDASKLLLVQATEQEKASAVDGGRLRGGTGGEQRTLDYVFNDPNYRPAPGGIEYLLEKIFAADGSNIALQAAVIKLLGDNFLWVADNLTVLKIFKIFGMTGTVVGGIIGILDIASGIENQDPFRVADGYIAMALAYTTIVLAASGYGTVGAPIVSAIGNVWGLASLISGDKPVTKRVWDYYAGQMEWVANTVSPFLGDFIDQHSERPSFGTPNPRWMSA